MEKPIVRTVKYVDYFDVQRYMKEKYNVEIEDLFYEAHNDTFVPIYIEYTENPEKSYSPYTAKLCNLLYEEFKDQLDKYGRLLFSISW